MARAGYGSVAGFAFWYDAERSRLPKPIRTMETAVQVRLP